MGRKYKPRLIPEQDKKICFTICICQLTVILSCVAFVYLSVAVYVPSYKAFQSGYEIEPVMCQTVNTLNATNCTWASCGEWCLTKTSGICPQINSTVRRNGTEVIFENCTKYVKTDCPKINASAFKRYNCNNGTQCARLSGVFNCTIGYCDNISKHYLCYHGKPEPPVIDTDKDNRKLNGFFFCNGTTKCLKIKKPFSCDRYCPNITTNSINVYILQSDSVHVSNCESVSALSEARGSNPGVVIESKKIWDNTKDTLITSCYEVIKDGTSIRATDCVNGTTLRNEIIPQPTMNFTTFWKIINNGTILDSTNRYLPLQSSLTIHNTSRLYINIDGCVNTLRDECNIFFRRHGNDGDNNTAQSRYPCYYKQNDTTYVLSTFDLTKTYRELMIAVLLPGVLFVISFITLCIIQQSVKVGDDSKMRCKYCPGNTISTVSDQEDGLLEINATNNISIAVENYETSERSQRRNYDEENTTSELMEASTSKTSQNLSPLSDCPTNSERRKIQYSLTFD